MSLTVEQVEKLLVDAYNQEQGREVWDYDIEYWYEIEELFGWDADKSFVVHGRTIAAESFDTGGEGHAEDIYMVFRTVDVDGTVQYWRKEGYYASFDGDNWDGDFREVKPVERVVTFYE